MKKCTDQFCHADNPDDAKYCHMCGKKITHRGLRPWTVVVGVASLLLFAIVVITNNDPNDYSSDIEETMETMPRNESNDSRSIQYDEEVVDEEPTFAYDVYEEILDEYIEDYEDSGDVTEDEQQNRMAEADNITRTYHSISSEYRYQHGTLTETERVNCTDEEWEEMKKTFFESRGYRREIDNNKTYHIYMEVYENGNDLNVICDVQIE